MYTSCIIILYYQWKLFFGDLKDISSIHHIIMCFFNQKQYMINDIVIPSVLWNKGSYSLYIEILH